MADLLAGIAKINAHFHRLRVTHRYQHAVTGQEQTYTSLHSLFLILDLLSISTSTRASDE
jgi:hypothetical protein